jgi:DNA-binding NtrC family response regulator
LILLIGQGDVESAAAALNLGNIFRFLIKPCAAQNLHWALDDCVAMYLLATAA